MSIKSVCTFDAAISRLAQIPHSKIDKTTGHTFFERMSQRFGSQPAKFLFERVADGDTVLAEKVSKTFEKAQSEKDVKYYFKSLGELQSSIEPFQIASSFLTLAIAALEVCPAFADVVHQVFPEKDVLKRASQMRQLMEENKDLLRTVKYLDLSEKNLYFLPPEILYFSELESLDLENNELRALPPFLFQLKQLKHLNFISNGIRELPAAIGELKDLETLVLQKNSLERIPEEIGNLTKLSRLNLAENLLSRLPDSICECRALIFLALDKNELVELPGRIDRLENLQGLYFYGNFIKRLPDGLFHLKQLCVLAASGNPLGNLPPEIGNLQRLRFLSVCYAELTALPKEIGLLSNLVDLSIDNNDIKELPEEMADLIKLEHFSFFNNPLEAVPAPLKVLPFWSLDPQLYPRVEMIDSPCLNKGLKRQEFSEVYWRLRNKKWKETIDGIHHSFGKDVYDLGLHDPKKAEPGYRESMETAFEFLSEHWNEILDADFYLQLHKKTCGHFNKEQTATWIDQKMVGVFRTMDNPVKADMAGEYILDRKVIEELEELNRMIVLRFGPSFSLCDMYPLPGHSDGGRINYTTLSSRQVGILFRFLATEFYYEIGHAKTKEEKRLAIARWFQYNEWLHPVVDGCGRTDVAMLNYLLTCYGFHPALLKLPYLSSVKTLKEWDQALEAGLKAWEEEDPIRETLFPGFEDLCVSINV